jgi:GntR family transcriptional regulator of vanillate catabolism
MASQIERVAEALRRRILAGELPPGTRIRELQYAPELGVSRTPLRLALVELEQQGLVERVGKRGFAVRRITMDDVAQAIDVRGVLEGLAVRVLAENGLEDAARAELEACVDEGRRLLAAADRPRGRLDAARWAAMNARFHAALVGSSGNRALRSALDHVAKAPLAAAGALGLSGLRPLLELAYLRRAQTDHEDVLRAILDGEGARAEALMREHARRSRDNKRALAAMPGATNGRGG